MSCSREADAGPSMYHVVRLQNAVRVFATGLCRGERVLVQLRFDTWSLFLLPGVPVSLAPILSATASGAPIQALLRLTTLVSEVWRTWRQKLGLIKTARASTRSVNNNATIAVRVTAQHGDT